MQKKLKRPRDPVQLAKLIGDIATGQVEETAAEKNPAAVSRGEKGGKRRAETLPKNRRSEIATQAAKTRWEK